ncbi:MAG: EAL domain-containing protein [Betaproteobacteria bacterium]|nr:EAL domain-containing protein [Betaproteobacteria bacterium]
MVLNKNGKGSTEGKVGSTGHRLETRFQPIFSVLECDLAGHEALVRPVDTSGKPVRPMDFLSALANGDLTRMDRCLRRKHLARFTALDEGDGMLCLNVHPIAAKGDEGAAEDLLEALGERGFPASRLCLEVLEDDATDHETLSLAIRTWRGLGFKVAMDDFGVRHSSTDRVTQFGVDFVKLDRSLLSGVARGEQPLSRLSAMIRRLQDAGMAVIIEGVEEAIEAYYAIEAGADFLQGYFLGAPLDGLGVDPVVGKLVCEMKRRSLGLPR